MIQTNVHILATVLDEKLMDATLLVFKTLRVGFPTANVTIWGNELTPQEASQINAVDPNCGMIPLSKVSHDRWIEGLLDKSPEPFWIVDTDIVFWDCVESFPTNGVALMGRFEPAFVEPWSGTHKVPRLHTSLLYMDPQLIRNKQRAWMGKWHPKNFPFLPEVSMIRQTYLPQGEGKPPLFYDTCAGLYQAIGGVPFTEKQDACFEHLHCGIYSNRIESALPGIGDVHRVVFRDVNAAKGLREQQSKYYQDHAILQ